MQFSEKYKTSTDTKRLGFLSYIWQRIGRTARKTAIPYSDIVRCSVRVDLNSTNDLFKGNSSFFVWLNPSSNLRPLTWSLHKHRNDANLWRKGMRIKELVGVEIILTLCRLLRLQVKGRIV